MERAKIGKFFIIDVGESIKKQYGLETILLTPEELSKSIGRMNKSLEREE